MKSLFFVILTLPQISLANCPIEIQFDAKAYCLDIQWLKGEERIRGKFQEVDIATPYLNTQNMEPAPRWIYSRAAVTLWPKEQSETPAQRIPGFKVFPFMQMVSAHSHSTTYKFRSDLSLRHI